MDGVLLLVFLGLCVLTLSVGWSVSLVGIFVDPLKASLFTDIVWNSLRGRCKSGMWRSKR